GFGGPKGPLKVPEKLFHPEDLRIDQLTVTSQKSGRLSEIHLANGRKIILEVGDIGTRRSDAAIIPLPNDLFTSLTSHLIQSIVDAFSPPSSVARQTLQHLLFPVTKPKKQVGEAYIHSTGQMSNSAGWIWIIHAIIKKSPGVPTEETVSRALQNALL